MPSGKAEILTLSNQCFKRAEILALSNQCFTDLRGNAEHSEGGDALHLIGRETCELVVDSSREQLTAIFDSGHDSRGWPLLALSM